MGKTQGECLVTVKETMARSLGSPPRVHTTPQREPEMERIDISEFGARGKVNAAKQVADRGKAGI